MKCFVTGASGFIGANLVHELIARGHQVKALLRSNSDDRGLQGADFVSHTTFLAEQDDDIDLTDFPAGGNLADARKLLRRKSPDFRCHIGPDLLKDWHQRMLDLEQRRLEFGKTRVNPAPVSIDAAE